MIMRSAVGRSKAETRDNGVSRRRQTGKQPPPHKPDMSSPAMKDRKGTDEREYGFRYRYLKYLASITLLCSMSLGEKLLKMTLGGSFGRGGYVFEPLDFLPETAPGGEGLALPVP